MHHFLSFESYYSGHLCPFLIVEFHPVSVLFEHISVEYFEAADTDKYAVQDYVSVSIFMEKSLLIEHPILYITMEIAIPDFRFAQFFEGYHSHCFEYVRSLVQDTAIDQRRHFEPRISSEFVTFLLLRAIFSIQN